MRKGRFAGLSDGSRIAVTPPALADLLLFDFRAAEDEDDSRLAAERLRSLAVSLPYLAASHGLWASVLLYALSGRMPAAGLVQVGLPLAAAFLIDLLLCRLLRGPGAGKVRPHRAVGLAALGAAASAGLWAAAIWSAGGAGDTILAKAAMICGLCAAIPALFGSPGLALLACIAALGGVALVPGDEPLVEIGIPVGLLLSWLSIYRARELILNAHRRLAMEWDAKKARRFVADYEQSGRGWFWETNADGAVVYASSQLAERLGLESEGLIGRPLEELLIVQNVEGGEELEPDARLPSRRPIPLRRPNRPGAGRWAR